MKECSRCKRTYDDSFSFCVVDGTVLSASYDPEATLIINEGSSQVSQNQAGIRFIKKGRRQNTEWAGMIVELDVSDAWSEVANIDDYSLPTSKYFTLPDPPYLVHIADGSLISIWIVYLPGPEDTLDDWPPIQVRSRIENSSGKKTKVGLGILSTISVKQEHYDGHEIPQILEIQGAGMRLLDDVPNQRTLSTNESEHIFHSVTAWVVSPKPFC